MGRKRQRGWIFVPFQLYSRVSEVLRVRRSAPDSPGTSVQKESEWPTSGSAEGSSVKYSLCWVTWSCTVVQNLFINISSCLHKAGLILSFICFYKRFYMILSLHLHTRAQMTFSFRLSVYLWADESLIRRRSTQRAVSPARPRPPSGRMGGVSRLQDRRRVEWNVPLNPRAVRDRSCSRADDAGTRRQIIIIIIIIISVSIAIGHQQDVGLGDVRVREYRGAHRERRGERHICSSSDEEEDVQSCCQPAWDRTMNHYM